MNGALGTIDQCMHSTSDSCEYMCQFSGMHMTLALLHSAARWTHLPAAVCTDPNAPALCRLTSSPVLSAVALVCIAVLLSGASCSSVDS